MPSDPSGSDACPDRRVDFRELWNRDSALTRALRPRPQRGRRVRRIVRHIEPWSVLKIAIGFHVALFFIICVASAVLWSGARASGSVDNLESFITSVGGFGNCEPVDGAAATSTTTTPSSTTTAGAVDQIDPDRSSTTLSEADEEVVAPDEDPTIDGDEDCRAGERLVGAFRFEDSRIFLGFILGGIVLVLAGSGAVVVLVLLFNLMSDIVGGVEVSVIEDDGRRAPPPDGPERSDERRGRPRFSSSLRRPGRD